VGGSEYEKGMGSDFFLDILFIVFFNSPRRETPKNAIKQIEKKKNGFGLLVELFVKTFRHDVFFNRLFLVFLNSHR
jgi:hypothetical protein